MSRGRIPALASVLAASAVVTAGCVAERVTGVRPALSTPAPVALSTGCPFNVTSVEDRREQKGLGAMGRTQVDGDGFGAWFAGGLAAMPGYSREPASLGLHVEVLKAYIQGLSTLKSANVVVRVEYTAQPANATSSTTDVRTYRGVNDSMNWSNSESEIQQAFDSALRDLTQQIGADVAQRCKR